MHAFKQFSQMPPAGSFGWFVVRPAQYSRSMINQKQNVCFVRSSSPGRWTVKWPGRLLTLKAGHEQMKEEMFSVVVFESVLIYVKMPRQHHFLYAEGSIKYPFTIVIFW